MTLFFGGVRGGEEGRRGYISGFYNFDRELRGGGGRGVVGRLFEEALRKGRLTNMETIVKPDI